MKKQVKTKNVSAPKKSEPDLEGFMMKVQEQLTALATKMDMWIGQIAARSFEHKEHHAPVPQAAIPPKPFQQPSPARSFQQSKPAQGPGEVRPAHGRRERPLYKAVCADCQKDCEIPFKPSGERPVYCKPCFAKRKSGSPAKVEVVPSPSGNIVASTPATVNRHVVVTKKGVGKVTVSEIVRPAARVFPSKDKSQKPAQKAKK